MGFAAERAALGERTRALACYDAVPIAADTPAQAHCLCVIAANRLHVRNGDHRTGGGKIHIWLMRHWWPGARRLQTSVKEASLVLG